MDEFCNLLWMVNAIARIAHHVDHLNGLSLQKTGIVQNLISDPSQLSDRKTSSRGALARSVIRKRPAVDVIAAV